LSAAAAGHPIGPGQVRRRRAARNPFWEDRRSPEQDKEIHMRKALALAVALAVGVGGGVAGSAGASTATKKKPPVKLEGKVENGGTDTVKNDAVTVVQDDFLFVKTFHKATPGSTVTVTVRNQGETRHTFTAKDGSFDTEVAPGEEATVQVAIPATGDAPVVYFCRFHGASKSAGMKGAFFTKKGVKEGAAAGSTGPTATTGPSSTTFPGYGY
jgi:hypothetical protein